MGKYSFYEKKNSRHLKQFFYKKIYSKLFCVQFYTVNYIQSKIMYQYININILDYFKYDNRIKDA